MKFLKFRAILIMFVAFALVFTACDETTDPTGLKPVITSITPNTGLPGDVITITGTDFDDFQGSNYVTFNTIKVTNCDVWGDTEIKVKVPTGATTGYVTVTVDGNTSIGVMFTVQTPEPVANLKATSLDNESVLLKWDPSPSESNAKFSHYELNITPGTIPPITIDKATPVPFEVNGLDEGTIYTFKLKTIYTNDMESTEATIDWSPASRFTETSTGQSFRMYESATNNFGSGLDLYDPSTGEPVNRKTSMAEYWNLALDTRTSGSVIIGSPTVINYSSYNITPPVTEIADVGVGFRTNSLSDVFDSEALDANGFSEDSYDLENDFTPALTTGLVIILRTVEPGDTEFTYAKVLIKRGVNGFLQGTAPNRYIEVEVSYQMTPGVPYAKPVQ